MRKPVSKSCGAGKRRGDGVAGGRIRAGATPPPDHHPPIWLVLIACLARGRIRADQAAKEHPSSHPVAARPLRRPNVQPARSKNAVQLLWPLVKALIRENRRDIDRKKLTATLQSVVDRKNHDGNGTIAYQLHTRRGRREHGAGICRRLLSELSRPVWKSTSASVPPRLHAIEQRLPSSRRR